MKLVFKWLTEIIKTGNQTFRITIKKLENWYIQLKLKPSFFENRYFKSKTKSKKLETSIQN